MFQPPQTVPGVAAPRYRLVSTTAPLALGDFPRMSCSLLDDHSVFDEKACCTQLPYQRPIVGSEYNCSAVAPIIAKPFDDSLPTHGVDSRQRLVEQQQLWAVQRRGPDPQLLPHAPRIFSNGTIHHRLQSEDRHVFRDSHVHPARGNPPQPAEKIQEFPPRQEFIEKGNISAVARSLLHSIRLREDVPSVNADDASCRTIQTHGQPKGCRLPCSVRSKQRVQRRLRYGKGAVPQHDLVSNLKRDVVKFQHAHVCHRTISMSAHPIAAIPSARFRRWTHTMGFSARERSVRHPEMARPSKTNPHRNGMTCPTTCHHPLTKNNGVKNASTKAAITTRPTLAMPMQSTIHQ